MSEADDLVRKIRAEARRQGLTDPDLAVAVAIKESSLKPDAWGDRGASLGLFQLQRKAAIDAGIDPHRRQDPDLNIEGGVRYLKQKLDQSGGNVEEALRRYNSGTPTFKGLGDPTYVDRAMTIRRDLDQPGTWSKFGAGETSPLSRGGREARPGLLARFRTLGPARAEAAEVGRDLSQELFGAAAGATPASAAPAPGGEAGRDLSQELFGTSAPAAETFPPLAEQEAAAQRQALGDAGPAAAPGGVETPAAPAAPPEPSLLQRLGTAVFRPRPAPEPTALAAEQQQEQARPWWQRGLSAVSAASPELALSAPDLPQIEQAVSEMTPAERAELRRQEGATQLGIGKTGAATGVSGVTTGIGAAVGGRFGGTLGAGLGGLIGSGVGRGINVVTGLEEPGWVGDVASVAIPGLQAGYGAAKAGLRGLVKGSRGWKAVSAADEANAAARQAYQEGMESAAVQTKAQRQAAVTSQQARETVYQDALARRRATAETRHQAQEAQRAQQVTEKQAEAVQTAQTQTQTQAREYAEQVSRYDAAKASQAQAVGQARTIAPRSAPDTPAHVLYKKVAQIAPEAPVTLGRTQEVAAELQDVLHQVPSLQPSRLQQLLTDVRAARSTQSVREVQRYLTDIGALTSSKDSAVRRTAKQLYGALHEDLAESAARLPQTEAARDLLLQANATFRREMAVKDLARVVRRAITTGDDGITRVRPGRILTKFDELVADDKFFAGSFLPEELTTIRDEFSRLSSVQKIPARPGAAPQPVPPKAVEPFTPTPLQPPAPPARRAPYSSWKPDVAAPKPPEPVLPKLPPREHGMLRSALRGLGMTEAVASGGLGPVSKVALALEAKDKLADALSMLIMNPRWRPWVQRILHADGSINRPALIALAGGRAALMAERRKEQEKGR